MRAWLEEMDDPPDPEQVRLWSETRTMGRRRYMGRGVLWVTLWWAGISILAHITAYWIARKGVTLVSIAFFALGPILGWMTFRDRWVQNERRYQAAIGNPQGGAR